MMNRSRLSPDIRPAAWCRAKVGMAVLATGALAAGALAAAGCGRQVYGASAASRATPAAATATSTACVQATPVVGHALGVLGRLRHRTLTAAAARSLLAADMAGLERLARGTTDSVLQESLAGTVDAFTAFRAVMLSRRSPAYQGTLTNLSGMLGGFRRACSVADPDITAGNRSWRASSRGTVLSHSATAHAARQSLRIANAGLRPALAGFTVYPAVLSPALAGTEQIGLWARAVTGSPVLTLQVRELSGKAVLGSRQLTMRLGPQFRFGHLAYKVRRPGTTRLSVTVSAAGLVHGGSFLVDDITVVRS